MDQNQAVQASQPVNEASMDEQTDNFQPPLPDGTPQALEQSGIAAPPHPNVYADVETPDVNARLMAMEANQQRGLQLLAELSKRRRERAALAPMLKLSAPTPEPVAMHPLPLAPPAAPAIKAAPQVAAPQPTVAYPAINTPVFPVTITANPV